MLTAPTQELLRHVRLGQLDPGDITYLEQRKADDLRAELATRYPICFQERRLKRKWEVSLARSLHYELGARLVRGSRLASLRLVPVLRGCLMLSGEQDAVTGIGARDRIVVRLIHKPSPGLVFTSSRGFKLDRLPDGWDLKPLSKKTVRLTEDFLRQRGWQFDLFAQLVPHP